MGFSGIGLAVSAAVLLPNLPLILVPPRSRIPEAPVPAYLAWTERLGQMLCLSVPAITAAGQIAPLWGVPLTLSVLGYWLLWARYVRQRTPAALFGGVWGVPVPLAVLPVAAFVCAALLLGNLWIGVSAAVLASGHIPVSLRRARALGASE